VLTVHSVIDIYSAGVASTSSGDQANDSNICSDCRLCCVWTKGVLSPAFAYGYQERNSGMREPGLHGYVRLLKVTIHSFRTFRNLVSRNMRIR
jgi:hypothetical protein